MRPPSLAFASLMKPFLGPKRHVREARESRDKDRAASDLDVDLCQSQSLFIAIAIMLVIMVCLMTLAVVQTRRHNNVEAG